MKNSNLLKSATAEDRVVISDLISRMGYLIDRHDWNQVSEGLCDNVTTDFVSLLGGEPQTQSKSDLVLDYSAFLPGFHALQHMINLVDLEMLSDDFARSNSYVRATHRFDDSLWIVGGIYRHDLQKIDGIWKISAIHFSLLYEEGDRALAEKASLRAKSLAK